MLSIVALKNIGYFCRRSIDKVNAPPWAREGRIQSAKAGGRV